MKIARRSLAYVLRRIWIARAKRRIELSYSNAVALPSGAPIMAPWYMHEDAPISMRSFSHHFRIGKIRVSIWRRAE